MKPEIFTEDQFNTRMIELREQLLFSQENLNRIIGEIEKLYQARMADHAAYLERRKAKGYEDEDEEQPDSLTVMRRDIVFNTEEYLLRIPNKTETFPARHLQNLKMAMGGKHPEWRGKLDGILSKLGTGSIFILLGSRGTGKTQLATAVARYVAETKSNRSKYVVLGDLFTAIKGTFKSGSADSENSILDSLTSAPLLVLDECHEITGTEWQGQILTRLIDARYREQMTSILITNHSKEAFIDAVGTSIADRIAECGYLIECDWPSFRRVRA